MRVLLVVMTLLLAGCQDPAAIEAKLDPALRAKLEQLEASRLSEDLGLLGKCSRAVDDAMRKKLRDAGAEVQSVQGDSFTAHAPSDKVVRIAGLDFVTQLQLSQTSEPLGR